MYYYMTVSGDIYVTTNALNNLLNVVVSEIDSCKLKDLDNENLSDADQKEEALTGYTQTIIGDLAYKGFGSFGEFISEASWFWTVL